MKHTIVFVLWIWMGLGWSAMAQAENRWAVVIGISTYQDFRAVLRYSASDARAIYAALRKNNLFPQDHIALLLNEEATKQHITDVLTEWLPKRVAPGDVVVIYYSGHGLYGYDYPPYDESDGRDEFLAPYDIDFSDYDRIATTGIRDDVIAEWLKQLPADTIVIFDSCYSGGGLRAPHLTVKNLDEFLPKPIKTPLSEAPDGMQRELTDLPDHIVFLAASLPSQQSWEDSNLEQSIFTHNFLRGLNGEADENSDGKISIVEAFNFARQEIHRHQIWSTLQKPVITFKKDIVLLPMIPPDSEGGVPESAGAAMPNLILSTDNISPLLQTGPITIDLWFGAMQPDGTIKQALKAEDFQHGDPIYLFFRTNQNCHIFLFNLDQNEHLSPVYPTDPQAETSMFVEKDRTYHVPGTFDHVLRKEQFHAVALPQPFRVTQDVAPYLEWFKAPQEQHASKPAHPFSHATLTVHPEH